MARRNFSILLSAVSAFLGCALGGCVTGREAQDNNPYHIEPAGTEVHGEAGVSYGQSVH